jgi:hypothetical protein
MLMEKRNAGNISSKENRKLSMHLKICKWCRAYKEKLEILDEILKENFSMNRKIKLMILKFRILKKKWLKI